jgi:hypothetical protein
MPNDRPSPVFFSLISSSLCAAVVLNCAVYRFGGPRVAMNNLPPTANSSPVSDNELGISKRPPDRGRPFRLRALELTRPLQRCDGCGDQPTPADR